MAIFNGKASKHIANFIMIFPYFFEPILLKSNNIITLNIIKLIHYFCINSLYIIYIHLNIYIVIYIQDKITF